MPSHAFARLIAATLETVSRRQLLAGVLPCLLAGLLPDVATAGSAHRKPKRTGSRRTEHGRPAGERRRHRKKKHQTPVASPSPPPPGPTVHADATCPGPVDAYPGAGANMRLAVTFEALTSGPLVSIELPIFKVANSLGDYILRLSPVNNSGVPTNDELASTVAANMHVPDGDSTVTFTFPTPYPVVAGTDYALVLTRSSQFQWNGRNGDPCPGRTFVGPDQTNGFTEYPAFPDLVFTTYVRS